MKTYLIIFFCLPLLASAQDTVQGMVMEANPENKHIGLSGANVYWEGSPIGTMTDEDGMFSIPYSKDYNKLIISFVGFESDTLTINGPKMVHHWLRPSNELDEVVVEQKKEAVQKPSFRRRMW